MQAFRVGNNPRGQEDDFPSCLYRNDSGSMEAIIARSWEAKTDLPRSQAGYSVSEAIIAIVSAIPSSILIYASIRDNSFLSSRGLITWVLAIAFGSTVALIEAL